MSKWISVKKRLPELTRAQRKPNIQGVMVLIWPHHKVEGASACPYAFYGTRVEDGGGFYIYGRPIDVTHWMPLPEAPDLKDTP